MNRIRWGDRLGIRPLVVRMAGGLLGAGERRALGGANASTRKCWLDRKRSMDRVGWGNLTRPRVEDFEVASGESQQEHGIFPACASVS